MCFWGRFRQVKNDDFIFAIFFRDFPPFFHATRAILREFWTFRRPWECSPSLHNPSFPLFPFPFFFSFFLSPSPSPFLPFPQVRKKCHNLGRCQAEMRPQPVACRRGSSTGHGSVPAVFSIATAIPLPIWTLQKYLYHGMQLSRGEAGEPHTCRYLGVECKGWLTCKICHC